MNNRFLALLFFIILILWIAGSTYCYVCEIKNLCNEEDVVEMPAKLEATGLNISGLNIMDGDQIAISNPDDIYFTHKTAELNVDPKFDANFNELAKYMTDHPEKNLILNGRFTADEGDSDLGLARANTFIDYFSNKYGISKDRLKSSFEEMKSLPIDEKLNRTYNALSFSFNTDKSKVEVDNETDRLAEMKSGLMMAKNVYFATSSSNMKTNSQLHQFFTDLKYYVDNVKGAQVRLSGHTDSDGSSQSNVRLSRARANDVQTFLIKNHGFKGSDFTIKAFGETKPIASNATESGMSENRRVEIQLDK